MLIPFIKGLWPMLIRFALAKPFRVAREFDVELIVACLINTAYSISYSIHTTTAKENPYSRANPSERSSILGSFLYQLDIGM